MSRTSTQTARYLRQCQLYSFFQLRVPHETMAQVAHLAKAQGLSTQELILTYIEWGIENDGHGKPSSSLHCSSQRD